MTLQIYYKYEIVIFVLIFVILFIGSTTFKEKNKWIIFVICLLAIYFTGVCHFTLLHRDVRANIRYELSLFWSYRKVIEKNSKSFFFEIFYNVLLMVPLGFLLPWYHKIFHKMRYVILGGLVISCFIEFSQLLFRIGLFEFDDILNNTFGSCIGYSANELLTCIIRRDGEISEYGPLKILVMVCIDLCFVCCFWRLWRMVR